MFAGKEPSHSWHERRVAGKHQRRVFSILILLALIAILALSIYVLFRGMAFFGPGYGWLDRLFAILLICGELYIFIHAMAYFVSTIKATTRYDVTGDTVFISSVTPFVAVVIASFNEDPAVLEDTIVSAVTMDYWHKKVYVVDDSTDERLRAGIHDLALRYECAYVRRDNRRGYKAGAINDLLKTLGEKYIAVFDADQKPVPDFLSRVVPFLEEDPKLAFVQTPQFYENTGESPVAFGAAHQQAVFYEYICEGKSVSNAQFSCGTNVVYRADALRDVGGLDETSVTEDFATSFTLHLKGWKSLYYNFVYVYGLGPESLPGYFTQQLRWALGTLGVFKRVVVQFFKRPQALKLGQWWEYFISGSYYFVGWVNFIFIICPVAFIVFGIRPLIADPLYYAAAFLPYFIFSMGTFYLSMGRRGYRANALYTGQSLGFISLWVLMNAAVMAMLNIRRPFGVTPKGEANRLGTKYIIPQLVLMAVSLLAVFMGTYKLTQDLDLAVLVNVLWAAYHAALLGMVFYFNRSFRPYRAWPVFEEVPV